MKVLITRAGILFECVECGQRFEADSPDIQFGHDCEVEE